jgi:hypothetical protein
MTRATLPHRRPNVTRTAEWSGHAFTVTIGLDPETLRSVEVFADTLKGGDMQATLADACVIISLALQHGITAGELAKSLARVPVLWGEEGQTAPASPLGAIVEAIQAEVQEGLDP